MAAIDYIGATIISTMVLLNTGTGLDGGYVASKEVTLAFLAGILVLQVSALLSWLSLDSHGNKSHWFHRFSIKIHFPHELLSKST